ncbi:MAG: hypothetical protein H6746_21135, partial [Deltaproteobacteria bacterium]|nr:hypothetical protein [Deltaproteobacteria bacterium]
MTAWVLGFDDIEAASADQVGGKGAGLAALARLAGVSVPPGFCVTTAAFERWQAPDGPVPAEVAAAIVERLAGLPGPVAVRSSAVGEDGAAASFAGLHDSFLGVEGAEAVLAGVVACWRSASSARAVAYRQARGLPASPMAVVVQRMVAPTAAGVLFTA